MFTWEELQREIYKEEKIDLECKLAEKNTVPQSVYETYSSFANTKGGIIILGVQEDKSKKNARERFLIRGVRDPEKFKEDFWNTLNSQKVNANILLDEDVYVVAKGNIALLVIHVPRADYTMKPVYKGENPFKGTFKRNHEGDYHAREYEVRAMIRDQSSEGNDSTILEGFTMEDIDPETLKKYRIMFNTSNPDHVWRELDDRNFLQMLGGYRKNRRDHTEGLTLAGLLMFGKGLAIREEFSNLFMDYREESEKQKYYRWDDRITYDGTWENNLFNFFMKVMPKLTEDLPKPFVLEHLQRVDDTPVHKAVREAVVNLIIHADYRMDSGVLKILKTPDGFIFSNPGSLKLPKKQIYEGGESKTRNPHMQTMLRMIGFGDHAGSGFPEIVKTWKENGWPQPDLQEDTILNQVILRLDIRLKNTGYKLSESVSEIRENEINYNQKNERSLSEVLSGVLDRKEYKKTEALMKQIEKNGSISPGEAVKITGKSVATTRRYLGILVKTGYVKKKGKTNQVIYENNYR